MDGFDTLRKRIQDESENTAQSLISNAKQERDAILSEAKEEASRIEAEHQERLERAKQEREIQRQAISKLEQRRVRLRVKQELLQDTLAKALEALKAYGPKEREALYDRWLKQAGASDETILIDRKDASWLPKFLAEAYPGLTIEESGDVDGGFILRRGKTWQDYRFASIFKQQEAHFTQLAADILFPRKEEGDEAHA